MMKDPKKCEMNRQEGHQRTVEPGRTQIPRKQERVNLRKTKTQGAWTEAGINRYPANIFKEPG
jgi:hypothetical protein